jgi:TetR/AcrR family transcriptional regulator, regulator of cefoperazone and chloramphenicol sensitivity
MPNVKNNASAQATCRRLMEAAGEVFAERGLHAATIKEITERAGVNTAAINYHFSDKFELHAAVIRHIVDDDAPRIIPQSLGTGPASERLRQFVLIFMQRILGTGTEAWKHILLSRELVQPTASFDYMLQGFAAPLEAILEQQVRELLGPEASQDEVDMAIASILGQCTYYSHKREMIARMHPNLAYLAAHDVKRIADYITDMTLAAFAHRKLTPQAHSRRHQVTPRRKGRIDKPAPAR